MRAYEHLASAVSDADVAAGGFGFGTNLTLTPTLCFLDLQPFDAIRAFEPFFFDSVVVEVDQRRVGAGSRLLQERSGSRSSSCCR